MALGTKRGISHVTSLSLSKPKQKRICFKKCHSTMSRTCRQIFSFRANKQGMNKWRHTCDTQSEREASSLLRIFFFGLSLFFRSTLLCQGDNTQTNSNFFQLAGRNIVQHFKQRRKIGTPFVVTYFGINKAFRFVLNLKVFASLFCFRCYRV